MSEPIYDMALVVVIGGKSVRSIATRDRKQYTVLSKYAPSLSRDTVTDETGMIHAVKRVEHMAGGVAVITTT